VTVGVAFVVVAGLGAVARAVAGHRLNRTGGFPHGTFAVNVAGSTALGLLHGVGAPAITVLGTGMLGTFTTFSSFVRDGVALAEQRQRVLAAVYVAVSLGAALLGAAAGVAIAR
jgi:CrcB protein